MYLLKTFQNFLNQNHEKLFEFLLRGQAEGEWEYVSRHGLKIRLDLVTEFRVETGQTQTLTNKILVLFLTILQILKKSKFIK